MTPTVSIIVITYQRPEYVNECLRCLHAQSSRAEQLIVVDASTDGNTAALVAGWPDVEYVANPTGASNMTNSRNVALRFAHCDVIAFLDDDAFADVTYVAAIRQAYDDASVGLACSRTVNGLPGDELADPDAVGKLLDNGRLTGNFAVDVGEILDIDHGIGATMSFRRETLGAMGGFREDYGGVSGVREDTDAFLRARAMGFRAVFVSRAVALHAAAPQARGQRFDLRYHYWSNRNHALLLINNFGASAPRFRRYVGSVVKNDIEKERSRLGQLARQVVAIGGVIRGGAIAMRRQRGRPLPPRRDDPVGQDIRSRLSST